jgi:membrane protein DedA with SNARE-associated domain
MAAFWDLLKSWGVLGVLAVAILDSAGIPNPGGTDLVLLALAIANPTNAFLAAALATAGSLIGSTIFYELMRRGGEKFLARRTATGQGAKFRGWFQRYGLLTVFVAALVPVPLPLKIFMACAAAMGVGRARFLLVMAAARIPRYGGLAYLGMQLGEGSGAWIREHLWQMGVIAAALFAALYILLRLRSARAAQELQ